MTEWDATEAMIGMLRDVIKRMHDPLEIMLTCVVAIPQRVAQALDVDLHVLHRHMVSSIHGLQAFQGQLDMTNTHR